MSIVYIIAGCNGAGKTTAANVLLPKFLNVKEFVNADSIAAGLSPFQPEAVSFQAGRIMLSRIKELINHKINFAFETTLSSKSYYKILSDAKVNGYKINLFYLWINSVDLAIKRIHERVSKGGHYIPDDIVKRRYQRSLYNLTNLYLKISNEWVILNNSSDKSEIIADGKFNLSLNIFNKENWNQIYEYQEKK